MLNKSDSAKILNGLVNQGSPNGSTRNVNNTIHCYKAELALFSTLPSATGRGGVEISLPGYSRVPLTGRSISGDILFNATASFDSTEGKYIIENTAPIQMHAIDEDVETSVAVLGFGIYGTETSVSSSKVLKAWGPLVDNNGDPVTAQTAPTLTGGSVPVFYPGDFALLFGGDNGGLKAAFCTGILNTLVQKGSTSNINGTTSLALNTYYAELALFTTLPNAQGSGAVEVPFTIHVEEEDIATGYTRKALYGTTPTSGSYQFAQGSNFIGSEMKHVIQNTDEIQMSAILTEVSETYKILGFGIYAANSDSSDQRELIAWGPLVDNNGDPVTAQTAPTLTGGSVPVFYPGNFKLMLGGDSSGETWVAVTGITLNESTATISSFTDEVSLVATVTPENASDNTVEWESSNPSIAVVNQNGTVSAGSSIGSAIITARGSDGKEASCTVTSNTAVPTDFTLTPASISIKRWTSVSAPTAVGNSQYVGIIDLDTVTPSDVATADRALTFTLPADLIEISHTNTQIKFYCPSTASTGVKTMMVALTKKPSILKAISVNVTAN